MSSPPYPSPHARGRNQDEEDPVEKMISSTGCAPMHHSLQDCMAEHQDWRKCQAEVRSFRNCMDTFQRSRRQLKPEQRPDA